MAILTSIVNFALGPRRRAIDRFRSHPAQVQAEQLRYLTEQGEGTLFGRQHGIKAGMDAAGFARSVPVRSYEEICGMIDRMRTGEADILWPGQVRWFAKSSGTTDAKSKYIPVTEDGLNDSHMQGPRDVMAIFTSLYPESNVFSGKTLTLGGSKRIEREGEHAMTGDLSAILIENTPALAEMRRIPAKETALMPDFDRKVQAICNEALTEDVTSFAGVPSWNLVMMNRILEYTGAKDILEVWPNMELFIHGGMNFGPYREQFRRLIPSPQMKYMETYNASEGFFAIADDPARDDMLLMLDYHIYYEFLALPDLDDASRAVPLEGVMTGVNYAMIISSSNGLWRYMIGDTVEFTSTHPYRIRITGRTKHYINTFGEEVVVDNAETAIRAACDATGAQVREYTVAPVFMESGSKGRHEWIVEFAAPPDNIDRFRDILDGKLQSVNSDYEAKRTNNYTLLEPLITVLPEGSFARWMEGRGKVGGQNKVPRLMNDRSMAEELLSLTY